MTQDNTPPAAPATAGAAPAFTPPELRHVTRDVASLGGPVQVRDMLLSERLAFRRMLQGLQATAAPGVQVGDLMVPQLLAITVHRGGRPLMTAQQWEVWGAQYQGAVLELFDTACGVCGFDADANAKN